MPLKKDAPVRTVNDVHRGDYVNIDGTWFELSRHPEIFSRDPHGDYEVRTTISQVFNKRDVKKFACKEDFEDDD